MERTWSTTKDRVAQANQWEMDGLGTTQLWGELDLLSPFTSTLFGTSSRSKGSCFPFGLSFTKTLQSIRSIGGSLNMCPHCDYGFTMTMDTYSLNVFLHIKLGDTMLTWCGGYCPTGHIKALGNFSACSNSCLIRASERICGSTTWFGCSCEAWCLRLFWGID
jgi:hypothetical protein